MLLVVFSINALNTAGLELLGVITDYMYNVYDKMTYKHV